MVDVKEGDQIDFDYWDYGADRRQRVKVTSVTQDSRGQNIYAVELAGRTKTFTEQEFQSRYAGTYERGLSTIRPDLEGVAAEDQQREIETRKQAAQQETAQAATGKRQTFNGYSIFSGEEYDAMFENVRIRRESQGVYTVSRYSAFNQTPLGTSYFYGETGRQALGREFGQDVAVALKEMEGPASSTTTFRAAPVDFSLINKPQNVRYGQQTSTDFTADMLILQKEQGDILYKDQPSISSIQARAVKAGYPEIVALGIGTAGVFAGSAIKGIGMTVEGIAGLGKKTATLAVTDPARLYEIPIDVVTGTLDIPFVLYQGYKERGIAGAAGLGTGFFIGGEAIGAVGSAARGRIGRVRDYAIEKSIDRKPFLERVSGTEGGQVVTNFRRVKVAEGYDLVLRRDADFTKPQTKIGDIFEIRVKMQREGARESYIETAQAFRQTGVDFIDVEGIAKQPKPEPPRQYKPYELKIMEERNKFLQSPEMARTVRENRLLDRVVNVNLLDEPIRLEPTKPQSTIMRPFQREALRTRNEQLKFNVELPSFFDKPIIERQRLPRESRQGFNTNVELPSFFQEPKRQLQTVRTPLSERTIRLPEMPKDFTGGREVRTATGQVLLLKEPKRITQEGKIITLPRQKTTVKAMEFNALQATTRQTKRIDISLRYTGARFNRPLTSSNLRINQSNILRNNQLTITRLRQPIIITPRTRTPTIPRQIALPRTRTIAIQRTRTQTDVMTLPKTSTTPRKRPKVDEEYARLFRLRKGNPIFKNLPKDYEPSLRSLALNIRASVSPKVITGFQARPIITRSRKRM